jgi:ubiquinone/menaquinone biosynthesis C-methylase UbiE
MTEKSQVVLYYQKLSKSYDKKRLGTEKGKIISYLQNQWFIQNLQEPSKAVCLEIGCGTGRLTRELRNVVKTTVAIDASSEMVRLNKKRGHNSFQENEIHYVMCDAVCLPFRDEVFTNVVSARVFWHIRDYLCILQETIRILKRNGVLLFDFPCQRGPSFMYSRLRGIKPEVLMLFIDENTLKQLFKNSNKLKIHCTTSVILSFIPAGLLRFKTVRKAVFSIEHLNVGLIRNWLFSYYLVKVIK